MFEGIEVNDFCLTAELFRMCTGPQFQEMRFATAPSSVESDDERLFDVFQQVAQALPDVFAAQKIVGLASSILVVKTNVTGSKSGILGKRIHSVIPNNTNNGLVIGG